jgi:hypothetical protein
MSCFPTFGDAMIHLWVQMCQCGSSTIKFSLMALAYATDDLHLNQSFHYRCYSVSYQVGQAPSGQTPSLVREKAATPLKTDNAPRKLFPSFWFQLKLWINL